MNRVLRADCVLEPYDNGVYLRRIDGRGPTHNLHPLSATTIALFNGKRLDSEVVDILTKDLNIPRERAEWIVEGLAVRYRQYLLPRDEALGMSANNPNETLDPMQFVFRPETWEVPRRLPVPARMTWLVTQYCNRHCIYCYANAKKADSALDATISGARMKELMDEAAELGVCGLLLTGGEPMIRSDILDIIEHGLSSNIEMLLSTKHELGEDTIRRLKIYPHFRLQLSFDSPDEQTADRLTASPGFWRKTVDTLERLAKHRVPTVVAAVLTSLNIHHAASLVRFLHQFGVKTINFAAYGYSTGRHHDSLFVDPSDWERSYSEVMAVYEEIKGKSAPAEVPEVLMGPTNESVLDLDFEEAKPIAKTITRASFCGQGRSLLAIRYDGAAILCDHMPDVPELVYGDLSYQSIMDVWNSEKLRKLFDPDRRLYAGTDCEKCDHYTGCDYKIACLYHSGMVYKSYYVPLPVHAAACGHYKSAVLPRVAYARKPGSIPVTEECFKEQQKLL